ncbi:outer membrane protein assembly factor BamE [Sphingomonas radiodurans]|uniref:outer membrane protein assembly factor BamE n=1 Tax=Sphingomonas radiodurans TaxID=2890321 RepID=UPI001E35A2DE|nr:outer membrane protein assembly factor BamE [Sphingomonas radiodurans]WBH15227.1 outer membrane protein assembly factor BamE [Sphingomonas radiodurans]
MRFPLLLAAAALGVAASACAPLKSHQGYIVDADLLNAIQPGVDNRQSVAATLGQPSFASQFNQGDWYYISRDSRNYAFNTPKAREQLTVQISFDAAGNVAAIRKSGVEQVASISPDKRTTPTLGRERGFFQDLFGNIGTVGAAGAGAGGAGGGGRP